MAKGNSINDQPPIGMQPDGELRTIEPGAPIPKPVILGPDGEEYSPEDFDADGNLIEKAE